MELKDIDLTNKCGSCGCFKAIKYTLYGECLQNPYDDNAVHDPEHPYWIVQRSRPKCRLYRSKIKPITNGDRIRAMTDEELAKFIPDWSYTGACKCDELPYADCKYECAKCVIEWLKQPAEGDS